MTRNRFILLLEKQLAEQFPGWKEKEEELTFADIQHIADVVNEIRKSAVLELWKKREPEVKA